MKKLYFLLLVIVTLTGQVAWSQCNNPDQFGTVAAPTNNIPVNITTCAFGGEFSAVTGAVSGSTYLFTATGGVGNFITIRQGTPGGTVLGFGTSPVSVVCTVSGSLFIHYNTNAGCGTDGDCHSGTVQCTSCPSPPAIPNDLCADALPIACGQTISATTVGATSDAVGTCVTALNTAPGVWYTFVGDGLTNTLSLCGSSYDTKIGAFTGACGALVCVTGNDDFCGLQSEITFPTVLGTTYRILVTGFTTNSGAFTLTRTCLPAITNDDCSGAININCAQSITGTTAGATADAVATCITTLNSAPGVWYSFTGNGAIVTLSTCTGTAFDSKIGVFSGSCGSLVCVTGNDDFCGLQSQVNFPTVFGTQYYVLVTGFGTASGAFTLTRTCVFPNETCSGAINIDCGQTINGSTAGAISDPVGTCVTALGTAPGIWYSFLGDGSPVTLATCGGVTNYDTKIGVFSGTCGSLVCVTGNDDFCNGVQSQVTFNTGFGIRYYILVTGFSTNSGNFSLTRTCVAPCAGTPLAGTISGPATACVNGTGTLTLTGFSGLPGIGIQWKSSTVSGGPYTNIPGATGSSYNFTATGVTTYYIATVTCANGGGNANSPEFTLTQGAPVHSSLSSTVTVDCSPGTATVTGTVINGGPGLYTHTLTGPGTITANASTGPNNSTGNFTVTNLPFGTHTFVLTSTDGIGCSTIGNISGVTIKQTPVITITPAAPVICNGDIQQLTASVVPPLLQTFSQSATTIIPASGTATPYPSQVTVAGLPTTGVTVKSVRLGNVNHTFPDDVDIVLVSPSGTQTVILMSDAGGSADAVGLDYTFDDAGPAMADGALNPTGTYRPTNFGGGDNWPSPGPGTTPTATTLSTFSGNPNGDWKLYVVDAFAPDAGFIGNWSITFSIPSLVVFSPTTGLYTNALATTQYTGTPISVVYAKPTTTTLYTATSTVAGCTGTATVNVTVNQPPAITVQPTPATQTICPGFNVTYSVTATGTGPLTYQWKQGATNLVDNIQISGATTNTLTISNVNSGNTGSYTCVVTGICAPAATSNAAVLNVATAPVISTQPANRTVCVGQSASFTVATVGSVPPPTIYQWEVSPDGIAWTPLTTGGSYTATFTIPAVVIGQHNTRYRVRVTNSCGQSTLSAVATLTVNALPTVTATALTQRICISDTLVPLSGSPVGGSWSGIGVSGFNFVPTATAVGTYNLTYTFTNAAGCTSTATVVAKVEDCQERLRLLRDDAVILFPNPNNGKFNIRINSTLYNYLGMKVYNAQGQLMNGVAVNDVLNSPVYSGLVYGRVVPIDLSHLPAGIYMVKFFFDDGVRTAEKTFKVVIGSH